MQFPTVAIAYAVLLFGLALGFFSSDAHAASARVALVIGNAKYENESPLTNPENDAQDLAVALSQIGFDVTLKLNTNIEILDEALGAFSAKANESEIALVFYAGHAIELNRQNYIIPVDAALEKESQIRYKTLDLGVFQNAVSGASKLKMVFLDACRNNLFEARIAARNGRTRSLGGRGLAAVEPTSGTVVAFSAKEGTTASDGDGRNSPYTKALLKYLKEPGLDMNMLLRKVRDDVKRDTKKVQEPFDYGSLPAETISLNPVTPPDVLASEGGTPTQQSALTIDVKSNAAKEAWDAVKDSTTRSDFEQIVRLFPSTIYATLAEGRIQNLNAASSASSDVAALDNVVRDEQIETTPVEPAQWLLALYPNVDFFGGDLVPEGIRVSSAEECALVCGNNLA